MVENIDLTMVNWARAQFALTAMYHWLFVPLTLGISWLLAFYETIYVKTGNEEWKSLTKFWMKLFGVNFAIGVATGIILEFEFGTNWANYSWMVGDVFGSLLTIEAILAFFLEATFFAVMFFGWDRVSKRFHLTATWMVAVGSNLSAVWILIANSWMQHPVGYSFNPDTARFEMQNFMEIILSPVATIKFVHATSSSMLLASMFVISIASWFLLKNRHIQMAKRSIAVAAVFGLLSSGMTILSGDEHGYEIGQIQPMKLAAFEGLYDGKKGADLVAFGILNSSKQPGDDREPFLFAIDVPIPGMLSLLANRSLGSFVPGINDLVYGNDEEQIMGVAEKIKRGRVAIENLALYRDAKQSGDTTTVETALATFNDNIEHLGYGYLDKPEDAVPPVQLSFYSFHIMVMLGSLLPLLCLAYLVFLYKDSLAEKRWLLRLGTVTYVLALIASQAGWVVAEVGRQPWAIDGLLPVSIARTNLTTGTVQTSFFIFFILFTLLLIAEIKIMMKQISIGPEEK